MCLGVLEGPSGGGHRGTEGHVEREWARLMDHMDLVLIVVQEDELRARTKELLEDNATQVLQLLIQYSQSSGKYRLVEFFFHRVVC